ncbi:MAG TPA: RseA family anti-sigma factor [Burkholderiaceae bacterium]|nr:RseA family anti-sigma factor [Burkholderiaceae bacterium]
MTEQANGGRARRPSCSEALSGLLDGELDQGSCRELFDRLSSDPEAQRTWALLNLACDALRSSETAAQHSAGFVSRVGRALADEPVILAPRALRRPGTLRRVVIPVAAVAAAAGVLTVVALPLIRDPVPGTEGPVAIVDRKDGALPVVSPERGVVRARELESYLEAHRESAPGPITAPSEYITNAALTTESR